MLGVYNMFSQISPNFFSNLQIYWLKPVTREKKQLTSKSFIFLESAADMILPVDNFYNKRLFLWALRSLDQEIGQATKLAFFPCRIV